MIYQQEHGTFYFACLDCGVCGPVRFYRAAAAADERAHHAICLARKAAA